MRLGRLPHDPAALARAPSFAAHHFAAVKPPALLDRSHIEFAPGLYRNDDLPDCSAAGLANAAGMVAALNGYGLAVNPDKVPLFYAACAGCDATDAAMQATDGAVLLTVLARQVRSGFDVGPQTLVGLHGTVPLDRSVLASAMTRLGHVYLGVTLRERDMELPAVWDVLDGRDDGAVVGGHCVVAFDYAGLQDSAVVRLATWGAWMPATWAWIAARTGSGQGEAHALVWRQLGNAVGSDLDVNADLLEAELKEMAALDLLPLV